MESCMDEPMMKIVSFGHSVDKLRSAYWFSYIFTCIAVVQIKLTVTFMTNYQELFQFPLISILHPPVIYDTFHSSSTKLIATSVLNHSCSIKIHQLRARILRSFAGLEFPAIAITILMHWQLIKLQRTDTTTVMAVCHSPRQNHHRAWNWTHRWSPLPWMILPHLDGIA